MTARPYRVPATRSLAETMLARGYPVHRPIELGGGVVTADRMSGGGFEVLLRWPVGYQMEIRRRVEVGNAHEAMQTVDRFAAEAGAYDPTRKVAGGA